MFGWLGGIHWLDTCKYRWWKLGFVGMYTSQTGRHKEARRHICSSMPSFLLNEVLLFLPLSSSSHNPSTPFSETQFPKASGDNSSCDEDSNYSLSPELPVSQESPLGLLPLPSPQETLTRSSFPSPNQVGSLKKEGDTVQLTFCKSRMQDSKTWVQMNSRTSRNPFWRMGMSATLLVIANT